MTGLCNLCNAVIPGSFLGRIGGPGDGAEPSADGAGLGAGVRLLFFDHPDRHAASLGSDRAAGG